MSLVAELKRRNVFRVGIAYVVGAWLLAQVADLVLDVIGAETWVLQSLVALLALGFIPALVFAWAFELTPEGIKKEKDVDRSTSVTQHTGKKLDIVIIFLLIAVVCLVAFERFTRPVIDGNGAVQQVAGEPTATAGPGVTEATATTVPEKSIAVLPFANRSNQNDDLYFTDGIHDDLLTQLAKVGDLTVISRTSVMEYRDSPKNIKTIAEELNVATVLEGGVQKVGDRVRINAQLIEAATDRHLWAETFDRELTAENIFELQSEISQKIVGAIAAELTPEELKQLDEIPTRNLAAYEAYLRARDVFYGANYARSQEAEAQPLAERAIELDPDYTDAQALMAAIYSQLYWRGLDTSDELLAKYRQALDTASALNPESPMALRAQANYHYRVENDYARSLELLQRAVDKAPGSVDIHGDLGLTLRRLGRWDESIASFQQARRLDPANRFYHGLMLETMLSNFDYQSVIENTVPLGDADPDDLDSQVNRAVAQLNLTGDLEPLKQVFEKMNLVGSTQYISWAAGVHLYRRDADAALEVLQGPVWQEILAEGLSRTAHAMQTATAWQLKGDSEKVREMDEFIVSRIEEVAGSSLQAQVYGGSDAALSLARLGRHEEGLRLVNQVMELAPYERDALLWCTILERRAMVRAMAGDADGALEDLAEALRTPCAFSVTPWQLHYDPLWDFFRGNPGFLELSTPDNLVRETRL